jgi:hypothetical protein
MSTEPVDSDPFHVVRLAGDSLDRCSRVQQGTAAAQPSASATSPTTSPDRFWRPAGSGPDYTLDHEEPVYSLECCALVLDEARRGDP